MQTDQLLAEADVIKMRSTQAVNRIQLFLALGGRLVDTPPPVAQGDS